MSQIKDRPTTYTYSYGGVQQFTRGQELHTFIKTTGGVHADCARHTHLAFFGVCALRLAVDCFGAHTEIVCWLVPKRSSGTETGARLIGLSKIAVSHLNQVLVSRDQLAKPFAAKRCHIRASSGREGLRIFSHSKWHRLWCGGRFNYHTGMLTSEF